MPKATGTKPSPLVLGIDQSYSKIGFAVVSRDRVIRAQTVDLTKLKHDTQKRLCVAQLVRHWLETYEPKVVMVERVRLFTGSRIAVGTIQKLAALTTVIVDAAFCHQTYTADAMGVARKAVPVYSVDTRAWKNAVLGSAKADKEESLAWLQKHYRHAEKVNGVLKLDNNAGDAACIARYAFAPQPKLVRER